MFAVASSWNRYSLPVRFATSPVHRSFASTPNVTPCARRIDEQRAQRLLEIGRRTSPAHPSHIRYSWRDASNVSRPADATNFWRTSEVSPQMFPRRSRWLYIAPSASGASPFDARPRRAPMTSGRCSTPTGHCCSHAPHVVHCHSTPASYMLGQLRVEPAGEQRDLVLQDQRLRIEPLPGRVGRAVHLAPAALDARERVEHLLLLEVPDRLEADLLLLEVEVPHVAERRRLEEDGDRRQHEVEVLRVRDQRQEHQQDDRVQPPVDRRGQPLVQVEHLAQERDHQRGDEHADQHRLPRQRPERLRPHRHPPDRRSPTIPTSTATANGTSARAYQLERRRVRDVDDPQAGEELRATVAGEGDEAPEDEGMRHADERLLGDDLRLEHDLADEPRGAGGARRRSEAPQGPGAPGGRA